MLTNLSNQIAKDLSDISSKVTEASIKFNLALASLDEIDPNNIQLGELTRVHNLLRKGIETLDKIK